MFETNNKPDYSFLSEDEKNMLNRINLYAEQVLGDIDPQQVRISAQLEKLMPIINQIAEEKKTTPEDIFIKYMDLASMISTEKHKKFADDMKKSDNLGNLDFKL